MSNDFYRAELFNRLYYTPIPPFCNFQLIHKPISKYAQEKIGIETLGQFHMRKHRSNERIRINPQFHNSQFRLDSEQISMLYSSQTVMKYMPL